MVGSTGRRIVVEFIGDASALRSATRDGEAALGSFSGKAQAAGRIAGRVLAGGLLLAGAAAISATKAAAEDEAAQSQLAQQLRQAAKATDGQIASTEAWITAQGLATGISDDELRPALARLATATGDVGEAQRLAALAMDVSAGSGKSYQQVTEGLAKAQNGNIGALGRLGIATKDADGKTKSLAQIQQDLADKYNGAASKAADTAAGKQKILTTQFSELQEQIGAKLLPVMVKLGEIGLKMVGWISENTRVVGIFLGALASLLAITYAVGVATKAFTAIQMVWSAITGVVTAAQWLLNAALTANPIGLIIVAIAALVAGLIIAYKKSETFRNIVNGALHAVAAAAKWVVDFIKDHWKTLLVILTGPIGIAVGFIMSHWDKIKAGAQLVIWWVQDHWGILKDRITAPFQRAAEVLQGVWTNFKEGFSAVKDRLVDIASQMKEHLVNAFDAIKAPIQAIIDKVQWLIDKIQDLINKIKSIPGLPNVPGLARGTGNFPGGLAVVGEQGPELVHLPGGSRVTPHAESMGSLRSIGGGGDTYVFNIQALTPMEAGKAVEDVLRNRERTTGRRMLVSPA